MCSLSVSVKLIFLMILLYAHFTVAQSGLNIIIRKLPRKRYFFNKSNDPLQPMQKFNSAEEQIHKTIPHANVDDKEIGRNKDEADIQERPKFFTRSRAQSRILNASKSNGKRVKIMPEIEYEYTEYLTESKTSVKEDFDFAPNTPGLGCLYGMPIPLYNTPKKRCVPHSPLCGFAFTCVMDVNVIKIPKVKTQ